MNKTSRTLLSIISLGILLLTLSGGVSASASELDSLGTSQGNRNEASSLTAEVNAAEQNNDGTVAAVTWSIENNGEDPVTLSWLFEGSYTDRKSTRLNSSHVSISYAVFCLKKKKSIQVRVQN